MTTLMDEAITQIRDIAGTLYDEVRAHGVLPFLQPVPPFDRPSFLAPAVAFGGLLALVLLSGAAVSAYGALLLSILALSMLLVDVFGFSLEIAPITVGR
jgi:hypothetical protein